MFWLSCSVYGLSILISSALNILSVDQTFFVLVMGAAALGMILIAVTGILYPDTIGGPKTKSPYTYEAIIAALLSMTGLILQMYLN